MWPIYAVLAAMAAAAMTIVGKIGLKGVDPTFATGVRSFFVFAFMAVVVSASGKLALVFIIPLSTVFLHEELTWKTAAGGLLISAGAAIVAL